MLLPVALFEPSVHFLNDFLFLAGPEGSGGKTSEFRHNLGQKLDWENLNSTRKQVRFSEL